MPDAPEKLAQTSSGTLFSLGGWLPWNKPKAAESDDANFAAQQPQESEQPAADAAKDGSRLGDSVADFSGQWEKDTAASDMDAYAKQVAMLHMSSVQTYAALHFMWGLNIKSDDQGFTLRFLVKRVPAFVFREVEHYTYDQQTSMSRRDRRPGQQTGDLSHEDGGVQVDIKWGDPYAAHTREIYTLPSAQVMHLNSTVTVGDESVSCLQVYNRK
jgi:hypothetical protein